MWQDFSNEIFFSTFRTNTQDFEIFVNTQLGCQLFCRIKTCPLVQEVDLPDDQKACLMERRPSACKGV